MTCDPCKCKSKTTLTPPRVPTSGPAYSPFLGVHFIFYCIKLLLENLALNSFSAKLKNQEPRSAERQRRDKMTGWTIIPISFPRYKHHVVWGRSWLQDPETHSSWYMEGRIHCTVQHYLQTPREDEGKGRFLQNQRWALKEAMNKDLLKSLGCMLKSLERTLHLELRDASNALETSELSSLLLSAPFFCSVCSAALTTPDWPPIFLHLPLALEVPATAHFLSISIKTFGGAGDSDGLTSSQVTTSEPQSVESAVKSGSRGGRTSYKASLQDGGSHTGPGDTEDPPAPPTAPPQTQTSDTEC